MKIKWHLVSTFTLIILVICLSKTNTLLLKDNFRLLTDKKENYALIIWLIEEEEKSSEEKTRILQRLRDTKILENKTTYENKKPIEIGKISKISWKELKELTLEKVNSTDEHHDLEVMTIDDWYYYPEKNVWDEIIKKDDTEKNVYIADIYDCDNFTTDFGCNINKLYLLNSVGRVFGETIEIKTGKTIGHSWNIILACEKEENVLYFFEPMTDKIFPVGSEVIVNGGIYRAEKIEWY